MFDAGQSPTLLGKLINWVLWGEGRCNRVPGRYQTAMQIFSIKIDENAIILFLQNILIAPMAERLEL